MKEKESCTLLIIYLFGVRKEMQILREERSSWYIDIGRKYGDLSFEQKIQMKVMMNGYDYYQSRSSGVCLRAQ